MTEIWPGVGSCAHRIPIIPSIHVFPTRMSTKAPHRERKSAPVPTDITETMIALKQKQAKLLFNPDTDPIPIPTRYGP